MTHVAPREMAEAIVKSAPSDTAVRIVAQAYLDVLDEWIPIASAPMDGTPVDLWVVDDGGPGIGASRHRMANMHWKDGTWRRTTNPHETAGPENWITVTHFRRIPEGPEQQSMKDMKNG